MHRKFLGPAILLTLLCVSAWFLSGCGSSSGGVPQQVATHLSVVAQNSAVAGASFNVTVTALDATNNTVTTYSGMVRFTSSDGQALLPPASTLTSGAATFSVTLKTPGPQTIAATDTVTATITGTSNSISVGPAAATHFSVTAPSSSTTGTALSFTVTALDASNNPVSSYSGTVHFTSTDAQALLPVNSTLSSGTGNFSATLKTLGNQTITATDTATASITGTSGPISVGTTAPTHFMVTTPGKVSPGSPFHFTVTALDAANNTATAYSGTVHFTSTDTQATLPPNSSLTNGTATFLATLNSLGSQNITATDTVTASITGTSNAIQVAKLTITSSAPPNGTVGQAYGGSTQICPTSLLQGFELSASGGGGALSWSAASLPPGLQIEKKTINGPPPCPTNSVAFVLDGTPTQAGTFKNVQITVMDSETPPAVATATYTITIAAAAGSLAITSPTLASGNVAVPYNNHLEPCQQGSPACVCKPFPFPTCLREVHGFALKATGGATPYTWDWTNAANSSLPPGLSINPIGLIFGTPTQAGTYSVTIKVTDSASPAAQTSKNYSLTISLPPPPAISMNPLPYSPTLNAPYSFTFAALSPLTPLKWSETGPLPPGLALTDAGVLSGKATMTGTFPISVTAQDSAGQDSTPTNFTIQVFPHGFQPAGNMTSPRDMHTATLLKSGHVLIAGGNDQAGNSFATAELFDPATETFTSTGSMSTARTNFAATLLSDGRVLVSGGGSASADIFDPIKGTFAPTGSMQTARFSHTSTLLPNGQVLVAGGTDSNGTPLATAEMFDPAKGTFTPASNMSTARADYAAVLLRTGKVLLIGGTNADTPLATAELFDPSNGTFTPVGSLSTPRHGHTATLLCPPSASSCSDDQVLVAGGFDASGNPVGTAELFNPASGSFTATGQMTEARAMHTSTLLNDGTVLLTGPDQTAEIFDPATGSFEPTGTMAAARESHTATLLSDGSVLVTGGDDVDASSTVTALSSAELYK